MSNILREEDPWRYSPRDPSTMDLDEIREELLWASVVFEKTGSIPRATSASNRIDVLVGEILDRAAKKNKS